MAFPRNIPDAPRNGSEVPELADLHLFARLSMEIFVHYVHDYETALGHAASFRKSHLNNMVDWFRREVSAGRLLKRAYTNHGAEIPPPPRILGFQHAGKPYNKPGRKPAPKPATAQMER